MSQPAFLRLPSRLRSPHEAGDLVSTTSPATVTMTADITVTASSTQTGHYIYLPLTLRKRALRQGWAWSVDTARCVSAGRLGHIQPIQDRRTVPIPLDRDPLHVDPGRRGVIVTKGILQLDDDANRQLEHHPLSSWL